MSKSAPARRIYVESRAVLPDLSLYDAQTTDRRAKKTLAELLKAKGVDLNDHR